MKIRSNRIRQRSLLASSATLAMAAAALAIPAQAVVPNEDSDFEAIVDNDDEFRGVGMFFRSDGFVCSGTLINPRTVLFAAHCVNNRPDSDYNDGTVRSAWSFNVNALPGFQNWINNNFASNPDLAVFNVNRINTDPRALANPAAFGFLEADIALASLDTPATGIPTWALLFSTLPAPETIDPVTGTGYHVNIVGYGRSGNAVQGAVRGIDWRRRAAENMLGGYFSLDDRNAVLFGGSAGELPQNLYHLDFDSQRRQIVFDINVHRDDALPNEGTTAGGDSGGPLILDAANNALTTEDLVIGVLSGGSRFFGAQAFSSLGTTSLYQPLSHFWQFIAENNPYRYVSTRAGNGNWEDPNHWVTLLDPAYRVINASGNIVNGIPTTPELGVSGAGDKFGAVCIQFEQPGDFCEDVGTGEFEFTNGLESVDPGIVAGEAVTIPAAKPEGDAELVGGNDAALPGRVLIAEDIAINGIAGGLGLADDVPISDLAIIAEDQPQSNHDVLPAPTITNGLPGATGFVANNIEPTAELAPRYFDVTLSQNGTTTLSSAATIDKLTIRGNAGLTIAAGGNLTSLVDINQFGGTVNVNGALNTGGDYTIFAGMLGGTGTITAPFVTSIMGAISPGTMGTIGTLTIDGNLVMASGTTYLVDFNATGASDRIAVTGEANVGGVVGLGAGLTQQVNGLGRTFTILTADGGVSGAFTPTTISPILSQAFTYQENAVLMRINAASYRTVIDQTNPVQSAYAQLWDQNRPNSGLAPLYALDFADTGTIRSTFDALAPVNETTVRSLVAQSVNIVQNFNAARLREADRSRTGGKLAVTGSPLQMANAALNPMVQPAGMVAMGFQSMEETELQETSLPESVGVFVSAGVVGGKADAMPGYQNRRTDMSGYYVAGGVEYYPSDATVIGASVFYGEVDADSPLGQEVSSETFTGSLFARHKFDGGLVLDGQVTLGSFGLDTTRTVNFLGTPQTLRSDSSDSIFAAALGLSYDIETSFGTISPGIEGRHARVGLDTVIENGGLLGLTLERETFKSTQARGGFAYRKQSNMLQFNLHGQAVFELESGPQLIGANFVTGVGPSANFALDSTDKFWAEVGISANYGDGPFQIGFGFDSTIGRRNAEAQVWRIQGIYRF
jgi:subtilase-type serine protease